MVDEVQPTGFSALIGWFKNALGNLETRRLRCSDDGLLSVSQKDSSGNTIGGAFSPADSGQADLTGSAAQQIQALPAGTSYIRFDVITAPANIKFGTSAALTATPVTAASGTRLRAGTTEVLAVPVGATHFGYIGNTASINWTPS